MLCLGHEGARALGAVAKWLGTGLQNRHMWVQIPSAPLTSLDSRSGVDVRRPRSAVAIRHTRRVCLGRGCIAVALARATACMSPERHASCSRYGHHGDADAHDPREPTTTEPHSGMRSNLPPPARVSPDEEAMRLMMEVTRRAQVAQSFAKLAGNLLTVSAAHASLQLRVTAEAKLAEMRRLARAARDAAAPRRDAPTRAAQGVRSERRTTHRRRRMRPRCRARPSEHCSKRRDPGCARRIRGTHRRREDSRSS